MPVICLLLGDLLILQRKRTKAIHVLAIWPPSKTTTTARLRRPPESLLSPK